MTDECIEIIETEEKKPIIKTLPKRKKEGILD